MLGHSVTVKAYRALSLDDLFELARLRTEVFYREQRVDDVELDEDDRSADTLHAWTTDETGMTAYLRVLGTSGAGPVVVGRVVTRGDRRGRGLASALLAEVVRRFGDRGLALHAQVTAVGVYRRAGFETVGDPFDEAGIPHVAMERPGTESDRAPGSLPTGKDPRP